MAMAGACDRQAVARVAHGRGGEGFCVREALGGETAGPRQKRTPELNMRTASVHRWYQAPARRLLRLSVRRVVVAMRQYYTNRYHVQSVVDQPKGYTLLLFLSRVCCCVSRHVPRKQMPVTGSHRTVQRAGDGVKTSHPYVLFIW